MMLFARNTAISEGEGGESQASQRFASKLWVGTESRESGHSFLE